MSNDNDVEFNKSVRVVFLCITMVFLGLFFLLFKAGWCQHTPEIPVAPQCKEEFIEMTKGYSSNHECSVGASIEIISSPPAPKAGIFCRCSKNAPVPSAAPASSAL
jgi:hypothetical protein